MAIKNGQILPPYHVELFFGRGVYRHFDVFWRQNDPKMAIFEVTLEQ